MLRSFEPVSGPAVPVGQSYGSPYLFPSIEVSSHQVQVEIDASNSGFAQLAEAQGSLLTSGYQMMWIDRGIIVATFLFHHNWLKFAGFTQDQSGLLNALAQFDVWVTQGGAGRLTWNAPGGYKNPVTKATIHKAMATAIVRGTPTITSPTSSNDYATLQCNIELPEGYWNMDDGSWVTAGALF